MTQRKRNATHQPKQDSGHNADGLEAVIEKQRQKEKKMYMMRVSRNTWIVVPKKKANTTYATQYKQEHIDIRP